jgi:putative ABC transport system substrate-binding protein
LVRDQVTVIAVNGTPGSLAAKAATQTTPIVFYIGTDPVGLGLVASLAHPGGNITGVTNLNVELFKKCFELMHGPDVSGFNDCGARQSRKRRPSRD